MTTKNILLFFSVILCFVLSLYLEDRYPILSEVLASSWLLLFYYDVYVSVRYRNIKLNTEIRVNNSNDTYTYFLCFFMGMLLLIIAVFTFLLSRDDMFTTVRILLASIALILEGLYFVPKALLKIDKGVLYLENQKVKATIPLSDICSYTLDQKTLTLTLTQEKSFVFTYLDLNKDAIERVTQFLNTNSLFKS